MIEVEKKYIVDDNIKQNIMKSAKFIAEVQNHDIYYDYPDFQLFKNDTYFRCRNGKYELKVPSKEHTHAKDEVEVYNEISSTKQILGHFGYGSDENVDDIIKEHFVSIGEYVVTRTTYQWDQFRIDLDVTDFGYKMMEIELIVNSEKEIADAERSIIALAERLEIENTNVPGKLRKYLSMNNPEAAKELRL